MVIILPQPLVCDQSCILAPLKAPHAPALHRYTQLKLLQLEFTSSPLCLVLKENSALLQLFSPTMIIIIMANSVNWEHGNQIAAQKQTQCFFKSCY